MSSDLAPLLIGLAAGGLLVILIGIVPGAGRTVGRIRSIRRRRHHVAQEGQTTGEEWFYRPPAPEAPEPPVPPSEGDSGADQSDGYRTSSSAAIAEVDSNAAELLIAAEREREDRWRESMALAERVAKYAHPMAETDEPELEATRIAVPAAKYGAPNEGELEQARAVSDALAALEEAERRAERLLAAAEWRRASIPLERRMEAAHTPAEIVDDARQQSFARLEDAGHTNEPAPELPARDDALRTKLDSLRGIQEAAHEAEKLLVAAERRRDELLRESEIEATRKAAEITEDAGRRAQERLVKAELEAKRIVDDATLERSQLVNALTQERAAFEETRLALARFLADALEEVDSGTANEAAAKARELEQALHVRTFR